MYHKNSNLPQNPKKSLKIPTYLKTPKNLQKSPKHIQKSPKLTPPKLHSKLTPLKSTLKIKDQLISHLGCPTNLIPTLKLFPKD